MENVWINLAVKDLDKTESFYKAIGFEPNGEHFKNNELVSFLAGTNKLIVHFFRKEILAKFSMGTLSDPSEANEMIITIGSKSQDEIIEIAEKVKKGGGKVITEPQRIDGKYYGCLFSDPDGHKWNLLLLEPGM